MSEPAWELGVRLGFCINCSSWLGWLTNRQKHKHFCSSRTEHSPSHCYARIYMKDFQRHWTATMRDNIRYKGQPHLFENPEGYECSTIGCHKKFVNPYLLKQHFYRSHFICKSDRARLKKEAIEKSRIELEARWKIADRLSQELIAKRKTDKLQAKIYKIEAEINSLTSS